MTLLILPPSIIFPWAITFIAALGGLLSSVVQKRNLKIPKIYLAYCATASIIQLWALNFSRSYGTVFWYSEFLHNLLLCALALEVIWKLLPSHFVKFWAIGFLTIFGVGLVNSFPNRAPVFLLDASFSASCTAAGLLLLLVFLEPEWTREYALVTIGVVAILAGDVISSFEMKSPMSGAFIFTIQIAPAPGLILLGVAAPFRAAASRAS